MKNKITLKLVSKITQGIILLLGWVLFPIFFLIIYFGTNNQGKTLFLMFGIIYYIALRNYFEGVIK